ncbi:hypothetical protein N5P37_001907 [Trichoderma harzianum]|nr:hypothetical protein N5P37_001907 [Trichoderma harzianum]
MPVTAAPASGTTPSVFKAERSKDGHTKSSWLSSILSKPAPFSLASRRRKPSVPEAPPKPKKSKGSLGLSTLYEPPDGVVIAEMIFIHGLGGGSIKTWCDSSGPAAPSCWPRDWLPADAEFKHVRIHTFGYEADWRERTPSILSVHDFAQSLLGEIKNHQLIKRSDAGIVFVGHSMGGCVAKKAYILARQDPICADLASRFHSMFFLATPHRGSELGKVLRNLLLVTGVSKPYVKDLVANSGPVLEVNETFHQFASDLHLWSFYESLPMSDFSNILVVDKHSATLGFDNESVSFMDADHRTICKFKHQSDHNYKKVRNALLSAVEMIKSNTPIMAAKARLSPYLGVDDTFEDDLNLHRESRHPESCAWVVDNSGFRQRVSIWMIDSQDTVADMRSVVKARLTQLRHLEIGDLVSRIVDKSNGSFIWIRLVLQELETAFTNEDVEAILEEVPSDLHEMYARVLKSIEKDKRRAKLAKSILKWITLAQRPMTIEELRGAVHMDIQASPQKMVHAAVVAFKSNAGEYTSSNTIAQFLDSWVLYWIEGLARRQKLGVAIRSAIDLEKYADCGTKEGIWSNHDVLHLKDWTTDISRVVMNFREPLLKSPASIHSLVPLFCPTRSLIHRQSSSSGDMELAIVGQQDHVWDECLMHTEHDAMVEIVICGQCHIAIGLSTGYITVYDITLLQSTIEVKFLNSHLKLIGFGCDDKYLAATGFGKAAIWETKTGTLRYTFDCGSVLSFSFSMDQFITISSSGSTEIRNLETAESRMLQWSTFDNSLIKVPCESPE